MEKWLGFSGQIPGLSLGQPGPLSTHPWCCLHALSFLPLLLEITGTLLTEDNILFCFHAVTSGASADLPHSCTHPAQASTRKPYSRHKTHNPPCADAKVIYPTFRSRAPAVTLQVDLAQQGAKSTCQTFGWLLLMFSRAHHICVDFIRQNRDAMSGGHWEDTHMSNLSAVIELQKIDRWVCWPLRIFWMCSLLKTEPQGLEGLVTIRQDVLSLIRLSMCWRSASQDLSGCRSMTCITDFWCQRLFTNLAF